MHKIKILLIISNNVHKIQKCNVSLQRKKGQGKNKLK